MKLPIELFKIRSYNNGWSSYSITSFIKLGYSYIYYDGEFKSFSLGFLNFVIQTNPHAVYTDSEILGKDTWLNNLYRYKFRNLYRNYITSFGHD